MGLDQIKSDTGLFAGLDEGCRDLRHDGIAVTAQSSHAGGNPMSQRECAGFNAPRFSIGTSDKV
jgi:hypothetical protein